MSTNTYFIATLAKLLIFAFMLVGWVFNLFKIVAWNEDMGMLVVRIIGAFIAPVGAIVGWL